MIDDMCPKNSLKQYIVHFIKYGGEFSNVNGIFHKTFTQEIKRYRRGIISQPFGKNYRQDTLEI